MKVCFLAALHLLAATLLSGRTCWPAKQIDRLAPEFAPWRTMRPEQPIDKSPFVTACKYATINIPGISLSITTHRDGSLLSEAEKNERQQLARQSEELFRENPAHLSGDELEQIRKQVPPLVSALPNGRVIYFDLGADDGRGWLEAITQSRAAKRDLLVLLEYRAKWTTEAPQAWTSYAADFLAGFGKLASGVDHLVFGGSSRQ